MGILHQHIFTMMTAIGVRDMASNTNDGNVTENMILKGLIDDIAKKLGITPERLIVILKQHYIRTAPVGKSRRPNATPPLLASYNKEKVSFRSFLTIAEAMKLKSSKLTFEVETRTGVKVSAERTIDYDN